MRKRILFIAMPSVHFTRWVTNLKDTPHELYWFDILDRGYQKELQFVNQITGWKKRKIPYLKGEYYLSKNKPLIYEYLKELVEITPNQKLRDLIKEINPDIIHSFELQSCSYPILWTMTRFKNIKWIYSCWGSDLYYYQNKRYHYKKIRKILDRVDIIQTDNNRDILLSQQLGFKGGVAPVIPGGGGYLLNDYETHKQDVSERKIILIKGYEHRFGRALNVIKALQLIDDNLLKHYEIVVFGVHKVVIDYVFQNQLSFKCFNRHELSNKEVLKLMGKSLIYIGNSISDGLPNTLIEAIIMGAFPIQSNPGGATEDILEHKVNGMLIKDAENINEIKKLLNEILYNLDLVKRAYLINCELKNKFSYELVNKSIIKVYE